MSIFSQFDMKFWQSLVDSPWTIFVNFLDIAIVTWLLYKFIRALAGTKIMSLVQGVVLFVILKGVAELIGLKTITYLMNQVITYGVIAAVVIFAPEIRLGLEKFGKTTNILKGSPKLSREERLVQSYVKAVAYLSPRKIGALVSIQQTQTLQEYISTGIPLDANISSQLLINIFIPNTPLHDGAVIIKGDKIAASCCYLPLSESPHISKEFGTRHRAAIGLSENSDAVTFIVSEETGAISVTTNGEFIHDLSVKEFETLMLSLFVSKGQESSSLSQRVRRLFRK
ncbi:diadenylate cyclase CdaA [Streptococcus saliviloxodontae]|uniref:Diadenylate cyclase n=1 Tax=Streptococcus saliviloxodontae TaxID=1349416 RepID=A0ABS2PMI8_9STRE|nr:diadenylate cyclase CdaA [Streptococcus saliviloxodontae]MBM7636649.1 diadenylate cyclase [Streptococcus saliviloxodontae]